MTTNCQDQEVLVPLFPYSVIKTKSKAKLVSIMGAFVQMSMKVQYYTMYKHYWANICYNYIHNVNL